MTDTPREPVVIPHAELSGDALRSVIESFVLREGTEYGSRDYSLDEKVAHVMRQLERGEARIEFDPVIESVDIVPVRAGRSTTSR
ncbi:YheU family protein [Povalibacter sp.]|uniref:YheU family protein n=1 Tax=Povalibacter sp. TaxID=1962978 RepID=UPI002F4022D1